MLKEHRLEVKLKMDKEEEAAFEIQDLVEEKVAWDPLAIDNWNNNNEDNKKKGNIAILDNIYRSTEKKIDMLIKKRRLRSKQGGLKKKTLMMERMEKIENDVTDKFYGEQMYDKLSNVTQITNKALGADEIKSNQEKLKGRFDLKINSTLPMKT